MQSNSLKWHLLLQEQDRNQNANQLVTCSNKFLQWRLCKAIQQLKLINTKDITALEPAHLIYLYPAIQTTDLSICLDPKMKAKKLWCHFPGQPFSKNHILCMPIRWYSQSAHFLTDPTGTRKGLETGPRHWWLVVRKGQPALPQGGPWAYVTELRGLGRASTRKLQTRGITLYGKKQEQSQASETTFTFSELRLSKLSTKQISKKNREKSPFPARLSVNGNSQLSSSAVLAQLGCVHTRPFKSSSFYWILIKLWAKNWHTRVLSPVCRIN